MTRLHACASIRLFMTLPHFRPPVLRPASASAQVVQFNGPPSPATASAQGAQLNGRLFPATASAEGAQFNGPPSLWERVVMGVRQLSLCKHKDAYTCDSASI